MHSEKKSYSVEENLQKETNYHVVILTGKHINLKNEIN